MTLAFIYDAPLRPENGGTERATKLVMDELRRRGHICFGILHHDQQKPTEHFLNEQMVPSLYNFLHENNVDVVVNQIAFHPRFLRQFLAEGGQRWKDEGGKIISFMHLDPTPAPKQKLKKYFADWSKKSFFGKLKRLFFVATLPYFRYKEDKEYKVGLRYLYNHSDRYVLMSRSFTDIFVALTGIEETSKMEYITNMLTFPEIANETIVENKEKIVLVVARLDDEQKNHSFIINTWKSIADHKDYELHILGEGQDLEMLKSMAIDTPDIIFEGSQSPLEWYKKASIFLMASPREGWGLTLTESLQNGVVPVVLNTSSVFRDIIIDGENGFLAQNAQEYASRISLLLSDNDKRTQMAINGLKSACRFSPQKVGDLWEKMLNTL